jgi:hypothetical protein
MNFFLVLVRIVLSFYFFSTERDLVRESIQIIKTPSKRANKPNRNGASLLKGLPDVKPELSMLLVSTTASFYALLKID